MTRTATASRDSEIAAIARDELDLDTIDVRNSDDLDFHERHVASIRAALVAAYEAGRRAGWAE